MRSFSTIFETASPPSRVMLDGLAGQLVAENMRWYLDQWEADKSPPTDPSGLRWMPDMPTRTVVLFQSAAVVLERGRGSCQSIAALVGGAMAAEAAVNYRRGPLTSEVIDTMLDRFVVENRTTPPPKGSPPNSRYYHAFLRVDGRLTNPTDGMEQVR